MFRKENFNMNHQLMLDPTLALQVQNLLGGATALPVEFAHLLEAVSQQFNSYEERIRALESQADDRSGELYQLNQKLQEETSGVKYAHDELSKVFNRINEGFFTRDMLTDQYIHMSVGCEKIYGYSADEFYANTHLWYDVIHPDDKIIVDAEGKLLNSNLPINSCYRIYHKAGSIRWIEVKAIPVWREGKLVRVDGVVNDVTARKAAEELLKDSEVKYRSFFEHSMDGVMLSKPGGTILEANPAACKIFGASQQEICSYSSDQLFDFVEAGKLKIMLEVRARTGSFKGEVTLFRQDRTPFIAELDSSIFKDAHGEERTFIIVRDISRRKADEAALLLNEQQLDLIYNTVTDSIFMISVEPDGRYKFVSVNNSFLQATGLPKDAIIDRYIDEVIPMPALAHVKEQYDACTRLKQNIFWEESSLYPTGLKTGIVSINPVLDNQGDCIRIIGSVHDITEQKKITEEIKKSERNFQSLINTINGIVWEANAETFQFTFVSQRAEVLLGYPASYWTENPGFWEEHIHPQDREHAVNYCVKFTREKKAHEFEYRMITADGRIIWLQDFVSVIINEDGSYYLRGVMVDITERKKSEQAIKDGEEKYHTIVEQATDAIFMYTPGGVLIEVNQSGCDLLGYSRSEFSKINLFSVFSSPAGIASDQNYLPAGTAISIEKNMVHKNGHIITVDITAKMLSDGRIIAIARNITERKITENKVKESIERLQRLSKATHDAVWDWNLLTEEVWWNEGFYKLMGYDQELPAPGLYEWTKKVHPDDRDKVINRLRGVRKNTIDFWEDEFRYQTGNGDYGTVLDRAYVLRNDAGKPIRVIGAIVNISERKKTEQRIADSEQRYRTLFEQNLAGIYQTTLEGEIITCNNAFARMLGYDSSAELREVNAADFYLSAGHRQAFLAHVKKRKKLVSYEGILKTRTGQPLHMIENISLYTDPVTGKEILEGMLIDITERKKAEAMLEISEERYRQIVETAQEGIWMMDKDYRTVFANKKMCEIFEYSLEEMTGTQYLDFMEESKKGSADIIFRNLSSRQPQSFDFYFITKAGKYIWASLSASPILDDKGDFTGLLAMITDITKRKRNEELLRRSETNLDLKNKELERKNKELEQFAYVASHDLQEPLRTTSSFVKLLKQQYQGQLDEKADKYLSFILDSSERMKILIKDLLDYSRIGNKHGMVRVNTKKIVKDVIDDLDKAIADTGATIISGELPEVNGYPTELKQLFQNLLINAIKFSRKDTPPLVKLSVIPKEGYWQFAVEDNGIGIEKEHCERIFIIFQRLHTRSEYQGSGIGLSHCKKIVELHLGKIWVESVPGKGSTFYFTIPRQAGM